MNAKRAELALIAAAVAVTLVWSWFFQPSVTLNQGLGWDGVSYAQMAAQCWHAPLSATPPFVFRPGAPCVAALIASDPVRGLFLGNVIAAVLSVPLLWLFVRRHIASPWVRTLLVLSYVLYWQGPLRIVFWQRAHIEGWSSLFMLAGFNALGAKRSELWLIPVVFFGVLFRETVVLFPFALIVGRWHAWLLRSGGPSFVAGCFATALTHAFGHPTEHFGFLGTAIYWAYAKSPMMYLHAVFVTFGPMLAILVAFPHVSRAFLREHPGELFLLVTIAVLGLIGGSDTERFLYWSAPIVLVLVGKTLEALPALPRPLVLLALFQALAYRVGIPTPDYLEGAPSAFPLLTPLTAKRSSFLVSQTPDIRMGAVAVAEYVILISVFVFWLRRDHARVRARECALP